MSRRSSDTYMACKNLFHNDMKIVDRDQLKKIMKEVVGDIVKEELKRHMVTLTGEAAVRAGVKGFITTNWHYFSSSIGDQLLRKLLDDRIEYHEREAKKVLDGVAKVGGGK